VAGLGDTWEWDARYWTQGSDIGPAPRRSHARAWDAKSEKVILFGGASQGMGGVPAFGDTWEWDGESWTQLDDTGPEPRFTFGMASDAARQRIVLFGGAIMQPGGPAIFADTWEWDGLSWAQRDNSGPAARSGQSLVFDEARGQTMLFGGVALNGSADPATWIWNGGGWTQVATIGPAGRFGTAMAADDKRVVLFSGRPGFGAALTADTWSWDGRLWTERQDIGPQPRDGHAMAFDTKRQRFVLFGGETTGQVQSDTWELAERAD
jgi:hypothetical protein